jgi:hypothetical protein
MNRTYTTTTTSVRSVFAIAAILASLTVGAFIQTLAQIDPQPQQVAAATATAGARL